MHMEKLESYKYFDLEIDFTCHVSSFLPQNLSKSCHITIQLIIVPRCTSSTTHQIKN